MKIGRSRLTVARLTDAMTWRRRARRAAVLAAVVAVSGVGKAVDEVQRRMVCRLVASGCYMASSGVDDGRLEAGGVGGAPTSNPRRPGALQVGERGEAMRTNKRKRKRGHRRVRGRLPHRGLEL